jgi:phage tail sheath gpL-like
MLFNFIPGNIVAPGIFFEVSSGGQFENQSRLLLIGHKSAAGSAVLNVPQICLGERNARAIAGPGSSLDDMFRIARQNAPAQEIWLLPIADAGVATVTTLTLGVPVAGSGIIEIAGEPVGLTIGAGDSANATAAALAAAINAYFNRFNNASLPVTATAAANVVTLTHRHLGVIGNEIDFNIPALSSGNAFTGIVTVAQLTAGTGTPLISASLAALGDEPFDWIVSAFSDDTNVTSLKSLLNETSGRWAWNRLVYGHALICKTDSAGLLTTFGLAQDNRNISVIPRLVGGGYAQPTWQWAAGYAALQAPWLSDGANGNVSRNQSGRVIRGLATPRQRTAWLDYATRNSFLTSGLSTWTASTSGGVQIDKCITTQRTTNGVTDTTFRDIQKIGQLMYSLRHFKAGLAYEHSNKAIADDNPANLQTISTPREIKATMVHLYRALVNRGVTENVKRFGEICVVERDADNRDRVNIYAPLDFVNPLDVQAVMAQVFSQYPS